MILGTGGREIHGEAESKIHTQLDSCVTETWNKLSLCSQGHGFNMSYLTWAAYPPSLFTRVTGKKAETKQTAGQSSLTSWVQCILMVVSTMILPGPHRS